MNTQPVDYHAVLKDLESRKLELETMIEGVRKILAQQGAPVTRTLKHEVIRRGAEDPGRSTIAEVARTFLASTGRPQTTRQVAEAVVNAGFQTGSKNFQPIVYGALTRNDQIFQRRGGKWSLRKESPRHAEEPPPQA